MTDNESWAILRQVVIGADDIEVASLELRSALGLAPGFADPILETIGLADETLPVGPESHLELVAALNGEASIAKWIAKAGGGGGYALSIQVPLIAPLLAAATEAGVRTVADMEVYGHRIVPLHPGDMGLLVELDEIADPAVWFWDDMEKQVSEAPLVDDVLAVEVSSADPEAQATLWATVFGVPVERSAAGGPQIALGTRAVRFVEGTRRFLSSVDLAVVAGGSASTEPLEISGVTVHLLAR